MVNEKSSKSFVNLFEFKNIKEAIKQNKKIQIDKIKDIDNAYILESLLSEIEVDYIVEQAYKNINKPVGITGYVSEYTEGDKIGSYRGSIFNEYLSSVIFDRIKKIYPSNRDFLKSKNSDHDNHKNWNLVGVNPLFRFIKYKKEGSLIPHYDAPYIKNDKERTLVTLVIYLTSNKNSGATRFIEDPQKNISSYKRNLNDWTKFATSKDIVSSIYPQKGNALLFDHRTLHDSEESISEKIIIRTDLIFEKREN